MKKHQKLLIIYMIGITMLGLTSLVSCKEDLGIKVARIGEKPSILTNLQAKEIAGGAEISYDLPTSPDLRYVKAEYRLESGRYMIVKESLYNNRLSVRGFATQGEFEVILRSVSVGEIESDPVTIKVKTGKPFYKILSESFLSDDNFYSTFGGININFSNPEAMNTIIKVFKYELDSVSNKEMWMGVGELYTKIREGVIRVRGQKPEETKFGIVLRDQWGNISDTITKILTPIEEVDFKDIKIFSGMQPYSLQNKNGDYIINGTGMSNSAALNISLFDGQPAKPNYNTARMWWGKEAPIPFQFTMDLGKKVQLSRIKMWGRNDNKSLLFQATHVKEFEVYGSNNPSPDGSWESWTKIGTFESVRPSGLPFGVNATTEDQDYMLAGEDFEVNWDQTLGAYKYIRIKVNCTWNGIREQILGNAFTVAISELKLFGKYVE